MLDFIDKKGDQMNQNVMKRLFRQEDLSFKNFFSPKTKSSELVKSKIAKSQGI